MPRHVDQMAARLPLLYREGERIRDLLGLPALQLEILDEDAAEVRRAHWFDQALELDEVARLAAILDFTPEPWQELGELRAWVHAIRDAMLEEGAVTIAGIQRMIDEYVTRFVRATELAVIPPLGAWSAERSPARPAMIENPLVTRVQRVPAAGALAPLGRFAITNGGLDDSHAGFLLVGTGAVGEYVPALINLTTGQGLIIRHPIPPGARLWIRPTADGAITAQLENEDLTDRCYAIADVDPGVPWESAEAIRPARAMTVARGTNQLWFFPLAHYDDAGLDRFLLALPELLLAQGAFDQTRFDEALFAQDAGLYLYAAWTEAAPARFDVELPAGILINRDGDRDAAITARARLELALDRGVERIRAAGVATSVRLRPFAEVQRARDLVRIERPLRFTEVGPTGGDRLREGGASFELTNYDDSTFR
jgi:hypothetical protein